MPAEPEEAWGSPTGMDALIGLSAHSDEKTLKTGSDTSKDMAKIITEARIGHLCRELELSRKPSVRM